MQYGITKVRKLKRAKNFKEILYPGEPEYKKYLINKKQGLSLTHDIVEDLNKLSKQFKIQSPFSA